MGSKRYYITSNIHAKYEIINFASACVYHSTSTALAIIIIIIMYFREKLNFHINL